MTARITARPRLGGSQIEAEVLHDVRDLRIDGRTVVVNPGPAPAYVSGWPRRFVPPFSSTVLVDTCVERAESVVLLRTAPGLPVAALTGQPDWHRFADLVAPDSGFPEDTALWRGPRHQIGTVAFDPSAVLGETPGGTRSFEVWINLWFAPSGTDCVIHNRHDFLEVHTQVHGLGRMQKFTAPDPAALYEDVLMSEGNTHLPFCGTDGDGFAYPWHQYRADTDCVWLAVEYHAEQR
jgi:hypothetical protein